MIIIDFHNVGYLYIAFLMCGIGYKSQLLARYS